MVGHFPPYFGQFGGFADFCEPVPRADFCIGFGRIPLKAGLLQNSVKVQNWRVLQNSVEGSIFVLQISVKQSRGAGSGSHLGYIPHFRLRISFDVLLLASKCGCRCSHSIDARPLCQTSGCSVYSTYNYLRYLSTKNRARAKRQKSLVYQRFSAFSPSVFRPFSMYKNCPHNVQVLPPMMYKDCPLNIQRLPPL